MDEMRQFCIHQHRHRRSLNFHPNRRRQQLQDNQLMLPLRPMDPMDEHVSYEKPLLNQH
jgi:hypothetical protein